MATGAIRWEATISLGAQKRPRLRLKLRPTTTPPPPPPPPGYSALNNKAVASVTSVTSVISVITNDTIR